MTLPTTYSVTYRYLLGITSQYARRARQEFLYGMQSIFQVRDMNFSILQCNIVLLKNILEKGSAEFRKGESSIAVIL